MKIVADENIPYVREAFSTIGNVHTMPGRNIDRNAVRDAEALLVRSITKVNADLLEGTSVKFVATATIGTDHLDQEYLDSAGIRYASAPGCNADSVADYITAAMLFVAKRKGMTLKGQTIGVIGCGNVGSRVVRRARGLGMNVIENDPPLARQTGDKHYRPLEEVFASDFITVHTPLTREGEDATYHLVDEEFLGKMHKDAILFNSSRGKVASTEALKQALKRRRISGAVLDVWENEPTPDLELMDLVDIATPHIAGYSFDGKVNGTTQIYHRLCEWLGKKPMWRPESMLPPPDHPMLHVYVNRRPDEEVLREAVFTVYPIGRDDARMREALKDTRPTDRAAAFDKLRKNYPRRREFSLTQVHLSGGPDTLAEELVAIGFSPPRV